MKLDVKVIFNKSLVALTLLLGVSPVFLMLGVGILPDDVPLWYGFPLAAYVLGVLSYLLSGKWRVVWTAFSALLLLAAGFFLLLPIGIYASLLMLAALIYLLMLPPAYRKPLGEEWSFALWAVCLGIHLIANGVAWKNDLFAAARTPLNWAFALFALFGSLLINYVSLRNGMGDNSRPPKAIRRRNMIATGALYAVALLVALWDTVGRWLEAVGEFLKRIAAAIMMFIAGLFPESDAGGGGGQGGMDLSGLTDGETPEPSAFAKLLEKIAMYIALALCAAAALFLLYIIGKKLIKALKKFLARLREYASAVGDSYTDQEESTFSLDQLTQSAREGLQKLLRRRERPTPWKQLDGRARVRRLYRDYAKRRAVEPSETAREALTKDKRLPAAKAFSDLYDVARYSDHPIDPAEADRLKEQVEKEKADNL